MDTGLTVEPCVKPRLTKMKNSCGVLILARNGAVIGSCDDQLTGLLRAAAGMTLWIFVKDKTCAVCLFPMTW